MKAAPCPVETSRSWCGRYGLDLEYREKLQDLEVPLFIVVACQVQVLSEAVRPLRRLAVVEKGRKNALVLPLARGAHKYLTQACTSA